MRRKHAPELGMQLVQDVRDMREHVVPFFGVGLDVVHGRQVVGVAQMKHVVRALERIEVPFDAARIDVVVERTHRPRDDAVVVAPDAHGVSYRKMHRSRRTTRVRKLR